MSVTGVGTNLKETASIRNGVTAPSSRVDHRAESRNARLATLVADLEAGEMDLKRRAEAGDEQAKWLRGIPSAPFAERAKWELIRQSRERAEWCGRCGRDLDPSEPVWRDYGTGVCGECCCRSWRRWLSYPCEACGRIVHYRWRSKHPACCEVHRRRALASRRLIARTKARTGTICATCGNPFTPPRADARYCSPACRQRAYRQRKPTPTEGETRE